MGKDKEKYYADYDEDSQSYCVFDIETGKAHASFATIVQAEKEANEMNKTETKEDTNINSNSLYAINYKIEELKKQKEKVKKDLIENKLDEMTKLIITENSKSPLNERELKNFLKAYTYDIKEIMKD